MKNYINNHYYGLYVPIRWFYMITEKQLKIFETIHPFVEHTRNSIKKASKEKSNNMLAKTINLLKKENILLEKKVGKSGLLTLNLDNDLTYYYIALCNNNKFDLENLKKEIPTPFYSIVIFGSHAINKQKKDSDLNIAIFVENKSSILEASINNAKLKSIINMDIHIISRKEMVEMLKTSDENLGKQIARKHLTIYNHKIFYDIIREGMKNGFRI